MSTQTEITRLQTARNKLRTWLVGLGLAASTDKLDALADKAAAIKNQGAVDANVKEGESYTIPAGYHNGSGTVKGVSGGGNYNLQAKSVTPTKEQQSITPDQGYYGLSGVTVGAIPENYQDVSATTAAPGDVLANKVFIDADGVTQAGTMPDNGAVEKVLDATAGNQEYTVPAGKHSGTGKVSVVLETKSATPTEAAQDITPTKGKVLGKVTVGAIPAKYKDVSGVTAGAADVLDGKFIVLADGRKVEGTMANNGAIAKTIDGLTQTSAAIPAGYTSGGTVSLKEADMSVQSQIDRLAGAKTTLGNYLQQNGVAVPSGATLDEMALQLADVIEKQNKITAAGILKGDGAGSVSTAKAGTDYATPAQVTAKQDVLLASGASVGDLIKVKAVDASGKPTAWAVAVAGTDYMKTGNITKQTLVSAETTPTENYAINWKYE